MSPKIFEGKAKVKEMRNDARCKCGVLVAVSHFYSALDHSWVGKREPKARKSRRTAQPLTGGS